MSAFKEAFNNMSTSNSAPNLSIRGQAGGSGAPSTRGISNALRAAGIGGRSGRNTPGADGMDVDAAPGPGGGNGSGVGRARGGKHRAVRADPMSQAGRSSGPRGTHARRASDSGPRASLADRLSGPDRSHPSGSGPSRGSHAGVELIRGRDAQGRSTNRARNAGTPPLLRSKDKAEETQAKREQAAKVTAVFNGEPFKAWLVSRYLGNGRMDMSKLPEDQFLKDNNIDHIGMRTAATNLGALLWRLIQVRIQDENEPIRVLSLANNNLSSLRQLDRLGSTLPHITALDFSYNPIASISELSNLLAAAEKRGRATSGHGGLKHLQELILTGCTFREEMISKPNGEATYKHEILRRFPMLRMLDGKLLNRVVFPIERQAKETYNEQTRAQLAARPFTFPADVRDGLIEFEGIKPLADQFCAKFFDLYDNNRPALLPAYAPGSTFSISCNPTSSRSLIATQVDATRHDRPRQGPFTPYVDLPSRNFLRSATSIEVRMQTLKSVDQPNELLKQWAAIPPTKHPLTDASKWMLDNWVLDKWDGPNGTEATIMLVVQGEFQELDGTKGFRSFSRTFVLKTLPDNAPLRQQGWTLQILSDTLIVHPYLSNAATMGVQRTLVGNGVTIDAPLPVAPPAPAPAPSSAPVTSASNPLEGLNEQQIAIAQQLSQATGMNAYFSVMCAAGNEWDYQRALTNFGEIRGTIPADAFQQ